MRVKVFHRLYGCDTGCCGHAIEVDDEEVEDSFRFWHPDNRDDLIDFVKARIPKECWGTIDWDSIEMPDQGECC